MSNKLFQCYLPSHLSVKHFLSYVNTYIFIELKKMILKFICRVKTYQKNLEMRDKGEFGLLEFEFIEQIKKLEKTHGQTD